MSWLHNTKFALGICILMLLATHLYYPKWSLKGTESTISWDVSGYYLYLPAAFIYNDIKKLGFYEDILKSYYPAPGFDQAFYHERSGNYVMKYSMGLAIQMSPFFLIGHGVAAISDRYPADGFSFPYQLLISLGSLLVAILGLIVISHSLRQYFPGLPVNLALITMVFGSNYLNYAAIDGAMTHNYLFTLYSFIIFLTIRYYRNPSWSGAIGIGLLTGLATLTRPTEIISILIPLLWGINFLNRSSITQKWNFLKDHRKQILLAILTFIAVGSLQAFYWKYVSGEWVVYSYQDQGFNWLRPYLQEGLLSYKSGWLTYSPAMIFSLLGFYFLARKFPQLFWTAFTFVLLFIYIAFAWEIWWYGGSLGQRTMVQCYPVLLFPLAAFYMALKNASRWIKSIILALMCIFIYLNLWFTHQAHRGGMLVVSQMTRAYYWATIGSWKQDTEELKLLDTDEIFSGEPSELELLHHREAPFLLEKEMERTSVVKVDIENGYDWFRGSAIVDIRDRQWDHWQMTQIVIRLYDEEELLKEKMYRIHRLLNLQDPRQIHIDIRNTFDKVSHVELLLYNPGNEMIIKDLKIEGIKLD